MSKVFVLLMVRGAFLTAADLNIYLVDVEGQDTAAGKAITEPINGGGPSGAGK
jgi:hypothetical protein